jgi:hypothetical protein
MKTQQDSPTSSRARWISIAAVALALFFLVDRLVQVQGRLEGLEATRLDETLELEQRLHGVRVALEDMRGDLETTRDGAELASLLSLRLDETEGRLGDIGSVVGAIEKERETFGPDIIGEQFRERDEHIASQWEELTELRASIAEANRSSIDEMRRLEAALGPRDLLSMWRDIVGPVVQLAGDASVGSGVLLRSQENTETGGFRTHLITAWHVVRDIQGDLSNQDMPVPVFVYLEDGSVREEEALLLAFDADLDAALLEVLTEEPFENGAALPPRSKLAEVRIFEPVYAVGCPLGNDPIPTHGEVATVDHRVDGESYWMINAPTYIGNSGGGIFDSETRELLGIFSKIYTHGALRPTIVPHMGLVTPLTPIYDWLEESGYASVIPAEPTEGEARVASAEAAGDGE